MLFSYFLSVQGEIPKYPTPIAVEILKDPAFKDAAKGDYPKDTDTAFEEI